jgi:nitrilase
MALHLHNRGMKIAALQMVSTPSWPRNRDAAAALIASAAEAGAGLAVLPEYFCLMGQRDTDKLGLAEPPGLGEQSPIQHFLSGQARHHGIWLVGGTLPIRRATDGSAGSTTRVFNRCCVFAPDGTLTAQYDKLHLFAFDNGGESYDEGRTLCAGSAPTAFDLAWEAQTLRVGLSICYDLRFPELYRNLMTLPGRSAEPSPCDLLLVPAAFTHTTGRAHWEVLLRARAIENQCWVLASAQGGLHENGRRTWGHSMIIDPWGDIVSECPEGEGLAVAELEPERTRQVRLQLPALTHRRL